MAIGPYDNTQRRRTPQVRYVSQHVDMPFQQLKGFQDARTQKYYQGLSAADQIEKNLASVQALSQDKELRNERLAEYEGRIAEVANSLDGDWSKAGGQLMGMGKDLRDELNHGRLGAIGGNYAAASAYKKELDEMLKSNDINLDKYNKLLDISNKMYDGVESDLRDDYSGYSGMKAAKDVDLIDYVDKHLKDWKKNVSVQKGWIPAGGDKFFRLRGNKREYVSEVELANAAMEALKGSPEVQAYVNQEMAMKKFYAEESGQEFDEEAEYKAILEPSIKFGTAKYGYDNITEVYDDLKANEWSLAKAKGQLANFGPDGRSHEITYTGVGAAGMDPDGINQFLNGGGAELLNTSKQNAYMHITGDENANVANQKVTAHYVADFAKRDVKIDPKTAEGQQAIEDAFMNDLAHGNVPPALQGNTTSSQATNMAYYNAHMKNKIMNQQVQDLHKTASEKSEKNDRYSPNMDRQVELELDAMGLDPTKMYDLESTPVDGGEDLKLTGMEKAQLQAELMHFDGEKWDMFTDSEAEVGRLKIEVISDTKHQQGMYNEYERFSKFGDEFDVPMNSWTDLLVSPAKLLRETTGAFYDEAVRRSEGVSSQFKVTDTKTGKEYILDAGSSNKHQAENARRWRPNSTYQDNYKDTYNEYIEGREAPVTTTHAMTDLGTYTFPDGTQESSAEYLKGTDQYIQEFKNGMSFLGTMHDEGYKSYATHVQELLEGYEGKDRSVNMSNMEVIIDGSKNGMSSGIMGVWNLSTADNSKSTPIFLPLDKIGNGISDATRSSKAFKWSVSLKEALNAGGEGQRVYHHTLPVSVGYIKGGNVMIPNKFDSNNKPIGWVSKTLQEAVPYLTNIYK